MKKALVIDADESMRNLLYKFLLREGFEVAVASSNKEANEKILSDKYDVIIIDENIYKQSQFDMKFVINQAMPTAKVVYISSFHQSDDSSEPEDKRMVRCGEKIFRISELKRLIGEIKELSP